MSKNWEATQDRHLQLFVCEKENHDNVICEVLTYNGDDAKLIAAAPDLYDALEALMKEYSEVIREYKGVDVGSCGNVAYDVAGVSLAKARGEK